MKWQKLQKLMLGVGVGGIAIALTTQTPISAPSASKQPPSRSVQQLQNRAQAIAVKVLATEVLGTGILMQKHGQVYTVVTNAHVLRAADPPYQIQTPDGNIYPAELSKAASFADNDLGLLQFRSNSTVYTVASVGSSSTLAVGDEVYAAGFPFDADTSQAKGFVFNTGQISLVLDKALQGGYQLGYTSNIQKGMSGGPLLNSQGEVVGINGKHAYPLWETPDVYQDGSEPCQPLQDMITRSSWAVPVEKVVRPIGQPVKGNSQLPTKLVLGRDVPAATLQMQAEAKAAKSCTLSLDK